MYMLEKEIRNTQADYVKSHGIFRGIYLVTVTKFDGTELSCQWYKTLEECEKAAEKAKKDFYQYATVTKSIEFVID